MNRSPVTLGFTFVKKEPETSLGRAEWARTGKSIYIRSFHTFGTNALAAISGFILTQKECRANCRSAQDLNSSLSNDCFLGSCLARDITSMLDVARAVRRMLPGAVNAARQSGREAKLEPA